MLVSGSVFEYNSESLPGTNVIEVGTTNGVSTDENGNYRINVASPDSLLRFSFVGMDYDTYKASEVNGKKVILYPSNEVLEEVVVYGHKKRDYSLWYLLAGLVAAGITIKALSNPKNKPQPVRV